jgi:predicted N-acetyltransferase YhbS
MHQNIVQLRAEDFEEAMDFLNLAFSVHSAHDFARLLPLLYRPTDRHMSCNYAIRKNGRIRAVVGLFPLTWQVGDAKLRVAGIGGVSTHTNDRGTGLMSALMPHCVAQMRAQGYHLSYLGGRRQRYLYFGYERCGLKTSYSVSPTNLKHCFEGSPDLRLVPIEADDSKNIARAKALHDAQSVHCHRPLEDFYLHCLSWSSKPFAALDGDGRMVGYLVANAASGYVAEVHAEKHTIALDMVRAWVEKEGSVNLSAHPLSGGLAHALGRCCEQAEVRASGNWQIFDWVAVVDALLQAQHLTAPLVKGTVVLGIEGYGALQLQVDGGAARCIATDAAADLLCDAPTAMRLLFGPLPPTHVLPLPAAAAPLESWCPLPLTWTSQDGV